MHARCPILQSPLYQTENFGKEKWFTIPALNQLVEEHQTHAHHHVGCGDSQGGHHLHKQHSRHSPLESLLCPWYCHDCHHWQQTLPSSTGTSLAFSLQLHAGQQSANKDRYSTALHSNFTHICICRTSLDVKGVRIKIQQVILHPQLCLDDIACNNWLTSTVVFG